MTDNRRYANTGGDASATLTPGMAAATTPIGRLLLGMQHVKWDVTARAATFPGIRVGIGHSGNLQNVFDFYLSFLHGLDFHFILLEINSRSLFYISYNNFTKEYRKWTEFVNTPGIIKVHLFYLFGWERR